MALAREMAAKAPVSLQLTKQLINAAAGEDAAADARSDGRRAGRDHRRRRRRHPQLPREARAAATWAAEPYHRTTTMSNTEPPTPADALSRAPFQGKLLIDGAWVDAADGRTLERKSPAHDKLVAVYAEAGVVDAERAIAAARQAFDRGPWPQHEGRRARPHPARRGRRHPGAQARAGADGDAGERQAAGAVAAPRSKAPPTCGTTPPPWRATCTATATTRSANRRSAWCCASRSASSASSRPGTSRS